MSESVTRITLQPAGHPAGAAEKLGYSYGVRSGQMIWVSGQVSKNQHGELVGEGDIEAQIVQVMENVKAILVAGGSCLDDVVKTTIYITDASFREPYQRIRRRYFKAPNFPAAALIVIKALVAPELLVEVEAVAVAGSARRADT